MSRLAVSSTAIAVAIVLSTGVSVTVAAFANASGGQVRFIAKQSDVAVEGNFNQFSADVDLDPAHPQTGKIKVAIDLGSIDAGSSDANNLLKGQDFLDVTRFPSATFVSTAILATGTGTYQASGPFTLKGHTANLVIPFVVRPDSTGVWFEGSAPISRLAFNVGAGQWSDTATLDDEVRIQFKVHVTR